MKKTFKLYRTDGTVKKIKIGTEDSILTKRTNAGKVLFAVVFVIFALYAISLLFPFYFLAINSLKGSLEYINGLNAGRMMSMPKNWLFKNYISAFTALKMPNTLGEYIYLPMMLVNSIWISFTTVFCGLVASVIVAYSLAKYNFKLRGFIYGICIFNMTIPIIGSSGSLFKLCLDMGIYNTPLYIILTSFGGFGFQFLILYGFFRNISWSYAEAVFIDGGGHFTAFLKIMLPQVFPPMLTLGIMSFIGNWNDYMTTLLYMPDYPTLASGIYKISKSMTRVGNYPQYFAGLVVSIIPVIILFTAFSDVIMKNFTIGGLKG